MTPLKFILILFGILVCFAIGMSIYISTVAANGLPSLDQLENPSQDYATQIFSADGEVLDHFFKERRVSLERDSIPKDFVNALIAVEDRDFFSHWGVHTERIFKAMIKNILSGSIGEGASTITMQLARNLYETKIYRYDKSLNRKIREAITAMEIENRYTKDEIIEMYANTVNFGRGAYGIQIASQVYFDKSPAELTTAECAFLVGILKAPEAYNSLRDEDKALNRRNLVLSLMLKHHYINDYTYENAIQEPITLARSGEGRNRLKEFMLAPHFVEMIRQNLSKSGRLNKMDLYRQGFKIYTTLNSSIQRYAKAAVEEHLESFQKLFSRRWNWNNHSALLDTLVNEAIAKRANYRVASPQEKRQIFASLKRDRYFIDSVKNAVTTVQIALVVINPRNGAILGMVGASPKFMKECPDAKYSLNHATQILRQPGSAFKPIVYTSALREDHNLTPFSLIECGPFSYTDPWTGAVWSPRGSGGCAAGEQMQLKDCLRRSINTASARLITEHTTPRKVVDLAYNMGIRTRIRAVPSLALGSSEVAPVELISAFGTFANNGEHVDYYYINKIEDKNGSDLNYRTQQYEKHQCLPNEIASAMKAMMVNVVEYGTGRKIRNYFSGVDAAGKTGTTNDYADAWFIGYTPELVAGVWVGFDDRRITFTGEYGYAAEAAAPVWGRLMQKIYNDPLLGYNKRKFDYPGLDSGMAVTIIGSGSVYRPESEDGLEPRIIEENKTNINPVATKPILPKLPKRAPN